VGIRITNEGKSMGLTYGQGLPVEVDIVRIEMAVFKGIKEVPMLQQATVQRVGAGEIRMRSND